MSHFFAPLAGLVMFALGSGYLMTLVPLRISHLEYSNMFSGLIGSAYYLGLFAGSFRSEKLVSRVGFIRSFSGFMAILCCSVLLMAVFTDIYSWILLRFINGVTVAGIFVALESWLLRESDSKNRGRILSFYMVSLYGAHALGQLFVGILDSDTLLPFIVIGALLSLSIFPPATTRSPTPELSEKPSALHLKALFSLTPSGATGCFAGGLVLGALYAILPIYLLRTYTDNTDISILLSITMAGGMILQYPIGHLSDFFDRRKVLIAVSLAGVACCLAYMLIENNFWLQLVILFFIGGATFTLYPLSISHGCDHMLPEDIVAGTQGLLLFYSVGACLGPLLGSLLTRLMADGLMLFFVLVMGGLACFFMWRLFDRPAIYSSDEQPFIAMPRTTAVVAQLDPRSEAEET
ncbi:MAG: MFS transporter [Endozoicomonas sp. (ex Botrylloides leachii)]|nr:MFS transporter [Endozoicomonas sp. (ex Botrylloides leachii)]